MGREQHVSCDCDGCLSDETEAAQPVVEFVAVCRCFETQAYACPVHRFDLYSDDDGTKDDSGKAPMELLPWAALEEVAHVMDFGRRKYPHGEHAYGTWRGLSRSRLWSAAVRHLKDWLGGEAADPETRRSHLAHAAACALMVLEQELNSQGRDDRPPR